LFIWYYTTYAADEVSLNETYKGHGAEYKSHLPRGALCSHKQALLIDLCRYKHYIWCGGNEVGDSFKF